jgi:hypothetical protein
VCEIFQQLKFESALYTTTSNPPLPGHYPPITPLRPNPANSSWSTPAAAEEVAAVSASSGPADARIAWLERRLAEAEERVRELEAERAA